VLDGVDLSIVGRADSRGRSAYNADLGLRRAEAVKELLVGAGVSESRIAISSLGAGGAVGGDRDQDAYSHGYDRRVDVVLLGVVHAPR
jgi:OOP family OmpA-OmpF porin